MRFYDCTGYENKPQLLPWSPMRKIAGGRWMNHTVLVDELSQARQQGAVVMLDVERSTKALIDELGHTPTQDELETWRIRKAVECREIDPSVRIGTYWPGNEMLHEILVGHDNLHGPDWSTVGLTIAHDFVLGEHYMSKPEQLLAGWLKWELPKIHECRTHWRCEHVVGINAEYYSGEWRGKHEPVPFDRLDMMVAAIEGIGVDAIAFFTFWRNIEPVAWSDDLPIARVIVGQ